MVQLKNYYIIAIKETDASHKWNTAMEAIRFQKRGGEGEAGVWDSPKERTDSEKAASGQQL